MSISPPSSISTTRSIALKTKSSKTPTPKPFAKSSSSSAAAKLNRIISPQREVVNRLARDQFDIVDAKERIYFRDIYDHLVRVHDITEGLRDLISGALDTYLSAVSNRTNEIMKTLTLVNVLFLPLSILVGFFGMNFFGEALSFQSPLPRGVLFWFTCADGLRSNTDLEMGEKRGWW